MTARQSTACWEILTTSPARELFPNPDGDSRSHVVVGENPSLNHSSAFITHAAVDKHDRLPRTPLRTSSSGTVNLGYAASPATLPSGGVCFSSTFHVGDAPRSDQRSCPSFSPTPERDIPGPRSDQSHALGARGRRQAGLACSARCSPAHEGCLRHSRPGGNRASSYVGLACGDTGIWARFPVSTSIRWGTVATVASANWSAKRDLTHARESALCAP